MAVSAAERAFVLELFEELGGLSVRAMMGGLAVYSEGRIFALVHSDGRIYVKAAGGLAEDLAAEGSEQFSYMRAGAPRPTRMGYWTLPDAALDDPDAACDWARRSIAAAGEGDFS